jgi:hypothetical protein
MATKLEELKAAIDAAVAACDAAIEGDYGDMGAIDAAVGAVKAAYVAYYYELNKSK